MRNENANRRSFLKTLGSAGMISALPEAALGWRPGGDPVLHQVAAAGPASDTDGKPKYSIKFGVIGLDHYHIMGITAALIRGGGELVAFYATLPSAIADFKKIYPNARLASSEDEILNDPSIQLVAAPPFPICGRRSVFVPCAMAKIS